MHFGTWTGEPLLRHQFAFDALEPHLDDIDELILLGDVFDFLFSSVEHAFAQAEPLLTLIQEKLRGKRVVFLAGNHDHHIVVRYLRAAVELKIASGASAETLSELFCNQHHSFFQRFLDRRLDEIESTIVYPAYRVGDVLLSHGHYLDAHLRNSVGGRILARSARELAGGDPEAELMVGDYEALLVPLTELLFTVAQMPTGTATQRAFYAHLQRLGRLLQLPTAARRDAALVVARSAENLSAVRRRLRRDIARRRANRVGASEAIVDNRSRLHDHAIRSACSTVNHPETAKPMTMHLPGVRACDPTAPTAVALEAYASVVRNLDWGRCIRHLVFAHTHQPLDGMCDSGETIRFWNTGSWIYEPPRQGTEAYISYLERAWPGTGVLIDTDRDTPALIEMLADYNPMARSTASSRVATPSLR
jgi:UDP-2,3-diacylglucosamine pyrophosphatase LpxH